MTVVWKYNQLYGWDITERANPTVTSNRVYCHSHIFCKLYICTYLKCHVFGDRQEGKLELVCGSEPSLECSFFQDEKLLLLWLFPIRTCGLKSHYSILDPYFFDLNAAIFFSHITMQTVQLKQCHLCHSFVHLDLNSSFVSSERS